MFWKRNKSKSQHLDFEGLKYDNEIIKLTLGKILSNQVNGIKFLENLSEVEFRIFSQMGDDGIIQYLVNKIEIPNKTFIEFGVENYVESNTRFLLMNNNWSGMIMDGSEDNINQIKNSYYYWKYDLLAVHAFVNKENINQLMKLSGFDLELGLLHIDIDGNDYWIWQSILNYNPIIVIVEYNSLFGDENPWTIPYNSKFLRTSAHYSNLYYGSSILSLCDLAEEKGYNFIGCNSAGNNAYFVRKDKIGNIKKLSAKEGYVNSKFSESRDSNGNLTYIRDKGRNNILKGLKVYNTRNNKIETL